MRRFRRLAGLFLVLALTAACQSTPAPSPFASPAAIDADLLDVTVAELHQFYADKNYTVTQVVQASPSTAFRIR